MGHSSKEARREITNSQCPLPNTTLPDAALRLRSVSVVEVQRLV
jgi:hypothetical protein